MAALARTAAQAEKDVVVFKALAHPVRLQIVSLVAAATEGPLSVGQIVSQFSLSQPTISHHLKVLREAGVLTTHRSSTFVYYRFTPTLREVVSAVLPEQATAAPPRAQQAAKPGSQPRSGTGSRTAADMATKTPGEDKPEVADKMFSEDKKHAKRSGKKSGKKSKKKKSPGPG